MLTLGSLFDGIGGFPLAAERVGIKPLWASEIEKFPIRVTQEHFPEMIQVGDITKLDGAKLPPVDIITGGSPCQDLSVARGQRDGLAGSRSGLFYEMIRVVKEMRDAEKRRGRADESVRPRWLCWENVPGAFSSGVPPGEDFRIVLEEIVRIGCGPVSVPRPDAGALVPSGDRQAPTEPAGETWKSAGRILLGGSFSLAWRVLDAQYWPGTPQRRRRVYIIADFAGTSSPKILFD